MILTVVENKLIALNTYKMTLKGNFKLAPKPGQFINIQIPGLYLRRPISVCDYQKNKLTIIYKIVGKGSEILSQFNANTKLDCLVNLGNGYNLNNRNKNIVLIGGGAGVPPLYYLAKSLKQKCDIILAFNSKNDAFYINEFKKISKRVYITTMDGSIGIKGTALEALKNKRYDYFYTCGPLKMMEAISKILPHGECSLEERMGCGFGACMGCTHQFKSGNKRICKEGPVFKAEDIIW